MDYLAHLITLECLNFIVGTFNLLADNLDRVFLILKLRGSLRQLAGKAINICKQLLYFIMV